MSIITRDQTIVQYIARFGQLTSSHIHSLVFADLTSHTPADRTLRRLVDQRYLARIERRIVGGSRGGSGQYVYQLGLEGHKLYRQGRYIPARTISHHSLVIADCYVVLHRLARQGKLTIVGYSTEPDCHVTFGKYELKPDLYAELRRPGSGGSGNVMFEIDMGTQGQRQITEKFVRYWNAFKVAGDERWPGYQFVLFVAIDDDRAQELRWYLSKGDPEQRALFKVKAAHELEDYFANPPA